MKAPPAQRVYLWVRTATVAVALTILLGLLAVIIDDATAEAEGRRFDWGGFLGAIVTVAFAYLLVEKEMRAAREDAAAERTRDEQFAAIVLRESSGQIYDHARHMIAHAAPNYALAALSTAGYDPDAWKRLRGDHFGGSLPARRDFADLRSAFPEVFKDDLIFRLPLRRFMNVRRLIAQLERSTKHATDMLGEDGHGPKDKSRAGTFLALCNQNLDAAESLDRTMRNIAGAEFVRATTYPDKRAERSIAFALRVSENPNLSSEDLVRFLQSVAMSNPGA